MRWFFVFSFYYAVFKICLVIAWHGYDFEFLITAVRRSVRFASVLWFSMQKLVIPLVIFTVLVGWRAIRARLTTFGYAVAGCVFLQLGFSFTRAMIPKFVPYYADPFLAPIDQWFHFGTDPWTYLFNGGETLVPVWVATMIYIKVWSVAAITFPVLLALTDPDPSRARRFTIKYAFCWIGLGTIMAAMFSSVGPVFFDRLLDSGRFAGLTAALDSSGLARSGFGYTQLYLWNGYANSTSALGSGMSAFPSVHVAIATLIAIYLAERWVWTVPVGLLFVASVVTISVMSGYHYAIDGYASIALMLAVWTMLRRLDRKSPSADREAKALVGG